MSSDQVSHGLNLTLELENPSDMPGLLKGIKAMEQETHKALNELHFVHFARFLPTRGNAALQVITEFDGPLEPYVMDFAIAIGDVFDFILSFVKNRPRLSVRDNPREFLDFVIKNNWVVVGPGMAWADYRLYSAYPERTVLDIIGPRAALPPLVKDAQACAIDFDDVQGNILRGYHASRARHFVLRVSNAAAARGFLERVLDGSDASYPQVTSAAPWAKRSRPRYAMNIGFTAEGLRAVDVPSTLLEQLPQAFLEGPAQADRATANGDVDDCAPLTWRLGSPSNPVHLLVSLYGFASEGGAQEFSSRAAQLDACWSRHGLELVGCEDAQALPGDKVHFGYVDGIAQPHIAGVADMPSPDWQPTAGVGQFLLGDAYPGVYGGNSTSLGGMSKALCQNASFAAVRLLEQDVAAFERLLADASKASGLSVEEIAGKLMGRYRDGAPLAEGTGAEGINAFDYAPSQTHPSIGDDYAGSRCPLGAHVRRMNPRSAQVAGLPHSRRLIRRGMPYGPAWDGGSIPAERGLFGLFFCADLARQFDFAMQQWANGDIAASGIRGSKDPIVGAQGAAGGSFSFPTAAGPVTLQLSRMVKTRGSLYLLVPGLSGLRQLARGFACQQKGSPTSISTFNPATFNPKDAAFQADPYPYYAMFRRHAPVALVKYGGYQSYWVFSHELVSEVCKDPARFPKRFKDPALPPEAPGLFFMDPPRHTQVRSEINKLFPAAMAQVAQDASHQASTLMAALALRADFDLITEYTTLVTRNVFMSMFGVPSDDWGKLGVWLNTLLDYSDMMLPPLRLAPAKQAGEEVAKAFAALRNQCPAKPGPALHCQLAAADATLHWQSDELARTVQHFALGGYLSMDFLLGTGIYNLLSHAGALTAYCQGNTSARMLALREMQRFDAPFQMADRFAAKATSLGGCHIPERAMVTVIYGSANRDERVFGSDADSFDIGRSHPLDENLVFGRGDHYCIGAPMADIVVPTALDALLDGMPRLRLTPAPSKLITSPYFRAFKSLRLSP